jgi:hypothetical protein
MAGEEGRSIPLNSGLLICLYTFVDTRILSRNYQLIRLCLRYIPPLKTLIYRRLTA